MQEEEKKEQQKILSDVSIFLLHANVAKCSLQKRSVKAKKSGTTISSLEAINYNKKTLTNNPKESVRLVHSDISAINT